ncbi:MAG: DNA polymerase III subunit delta [Ruminococcaceae bacterium]|nr:DNA polymerase III subunit delta [Oscillospiraceae bacterium]
MAWQNEKPSALQNLKAEIKEKQLQRLYLLHGEETFLMNHYLQQIKKLLVDDLTESFNFHRLNNENFDILSFADAVENLPMMAETTMVQVDDVDIFKLNESDREKLAEVLSDIPEYCTVVFTFVTVAWKPDKRLKKLWSAVEEHGTVVEFEKQNQRDLIAWITRHFLANQKRISGELCAYLIEITDGTMTALSGEIKKICAYSGAEEICRADIDAVVEPVMDAVVFQMTDLLGQKQYSKALEKLHQLLKMQQEPIAILGAIGGHFRRLSTARVLIDNGRPASELMSLCAMGDYAARKNMEAARRFSPEFCKKAAQLVLETDYRMKTSFDEQERLLEMLVLQLAQEA